MKRIAKLSDIVKYQRNTIVSKTVIDKKSGTVTAFAFDKGQGLSEHTAPFDALVIVIEGEVKITISGKPHLLKTGEMIIMPANQPHSLDSITKFKMLLIMIRS